MTSNTARKAASAWNQSSVTGEGDLPIASMISLRSDVQYLRDKWDRELLGTGGERQLLNDLSACLTAVIAWRP